jgi:hypothetical protein
MLLFSRVTQVFLLIIISIVVFLIVTNIAASKVTRRDCLINNQIDIVNLSLWETAMRAYREDRTVNRQDYAFTIERPIWVYDKILRQIGRARMPIRVKGVIVAYNNDIAYWSFPLLPFLSAPGNRGTATYQCYFKRPPSAAREAVINFSK